MITEPWEGAATIARQAIAAQARQRASTASMTASTPRHLDSLDSLDTKCSIQVLQDTNLDTNLDTGATWSQP